MTTILAILLVTFALTGAVGIQITIRQEKRIYDLESFVADTKAVTAGVLTSDSRMVLSGTTISYLHELFRRTVQLYPQPELDRALVQHVRGN